MNEFEEALLEWSKNTVDYLHTVVTNPENKELDLSFYAFQTAPKYKPNVIFLGINPGGKAYPYESLYKNPIWNLIEHNRMTPERFIQANPDIEKLETWKVWIKLKRFFEKYEFFNDYMLMNLIYFNTPNIHDLLRRKNGSAIFKKNVELTKDLLINVIQPKIIICLGTSCFDRLNIKSQVILKGKKRLVVKGELNGIKVFGIPHPSGSFTSNEDKDRIGNTIFENI
ncbi:uracil-DNA glycosylase family protein [Arcicella sp. DC2W]|uniref:Uracil-DNA glycosylase family protein n=1 Tax=Arcicella gelida TaxID=2984195 RepID=A0ABU5RZ06_9BACT|nr:uracil-DNA glycosylase family protein [Arcicella sp. DC2W]MEA5401437.1 uracil-DNA glycosylase family protein [Arcicella sp. DC2W]